MTEGYIDLDELELRKAHDARDNFGAKKYGIPLPWWVYVLAAVIALGIALGIAWLGVCSYGEGCDSTRGTACE